MKRTIARGHLYKPGSSHDVHMRNRYLSSGGTICPVCTRKGVSTQAHLDDGDGEGVNLMECIHCEATWAEEVGADGRMKTIFAIRRGKEGMAHANTRF